MILMAKVSSLQKWPSGTIWNSRGRHLWMKVQSTMGWWRVTVARFMINKTQQWALRSKHSKDVENITLLVRAGELFWQRRQRRSFQRIRRGRKWFFGYFKYGKPPNRLFLVFMRALCGHGERNRVHLLPRNRVFVKDSRRWVYIFSWI